MTRVIFLFCFAAAFVAGCDKSGNTKTTPPQQPVAVTLGSSTVDSIQRTVEVVGTLYGDEETTLSAKVPGRITEILKDVGDRVAAGEPLAQIDKTDYELTVAQKRTAVQSSLAKVGLTELPPADFDFNKVPTIEKARLESANAEAKFNRAKKLREQNLNALSEQDFADMKTAYDVARSASDVEVLLAKALVSEARSRQADLEIESQRLRDTTIRTPQSGNMTIRPATPRRYAVAARLASVGEYVREGAPLYRLIAEDPIKFRAQVSERFLSQIKISQSVRMTVEAYPDAFEGTVARISPQIETSTRTFLVEVLVANGKGMLQPGAFARGSILTSIQPQVTLVPQQAIVTFAGVSKVFIVKDDKAVEVKVETGQRRGDEIEIVNGLSGAVSIVVNGAAKLATGTPITHTSDSTTQPTVSASP